LKIESLRISNILSFEHKDNIDDCQEIKLDKNLNLLIGPNATGKSNFLEVISQLFKAGLIMGFRYNVNAIYEYEKTENESQLRSLIVPYNRRPHSLPKNYFSDSNEKKIKIKFILNDDDRANLSFIKKHGDKIIEYSSKYSSQKAIIDKSISDDEINNAKTFTFTFFNDPGNPTLLIPDENNLEKIEKFVLAYFYWFQLIQILIVIVKDREGQDWPLLKSTFALMSSYRSYSHFESELNINDQYQNLKNKIPERLYREGPKTVEAGQPIIFDYVKDLILDEMVLVEKGFSQGNINNKGKPTSDLINIEVLKNINQTLKDQLNLEFKINHRSINQYYFYFEDLEKEKPIQISDLSGGQKEIIHFIFSVFGHDLKNGIIIIDELELHLHPQKQKQMLEIIKTITAKLNIQFVIATHSSIFVLPSTIEGVYRFYKEDEKFTRIAHAEISEKEKDLVQFLTYTNSSKIFFSEKVILVEGDSDEYFFQHYFDYYRQIESKKYENLKFFQHCFDYYQKTKPQKYDNIEFLYMGSKSRYFFWNEFLNKFKIKTYFIGDLDNMFSSKFSIISESDLNLLKDEFDQQETTILKIQTNDKYIRDSKCYNKDLIKYIQTAKNTEWLQIKNNIESLYQDKIFILKEGELERYTESNKKLEGVIDFCKNNFATWITRSENSQKILELNKIFDEITTS